MYKIKCHFEPFWRPLWAAVEGMNAQNKQRKKNKKMKAVEETHNKSENPLAFERNDGQRSIPDERWDLRFVHLPLVIQYLKCSI